MKSEKCAMETNPMRRILLAAILISSSAGIVCAQEVTGPKAESVKKEIMKIEDEKVAGLLRGGSEPVGWIVKYGAEEIAQTEFDGRNTNKAQIEAALQPGVFKMISMKQDGHRIRVYDDGNVAVVTYHALGVIERNGKTTNRESRFTDVWVKQKGAWLPVLHEERELPKQ
jgi:ketosteroid isomerase-like protein